MRTRVFKMMLILMSLMLVLSVSGVFAIWRYGTSPSEQKADLPVSMKEFAYEPPKCVYITAVTVDSYTQNGFASGYIQGFSFPTDFSSTVRPLRSNASITYKITVYNNSDVHQWYIGPDIDSAYGSNNLIGSTVTIRTKDKPSDTSATFDNNDWVPPQTSRDFYVTYQFGASAVGYDVSTLVDFRFGVHMDAVYDGFLAVLNDKTSPYGYAYLVEQFEQKYAETGSTVIANVGDEENIFDNLFGGQLTIDVDGVPTPVTVLVERKNVDGRPSQSNGTVTGDNYSNASMTGCEYTVYITTDPLTSPNGRATVYAISYSCKSDGTWYQIGQLYEGTATREDYDPSTAAHEGGFDVDGWEATKKTYYIGDQLYYHVAQTQHGTEYDYYKTIDKIQSTNDQEFYNKINNSQILKKSWEIVTQNRNSQDPEYLLLKRAFEAMAPYYNLNNGPDIQIKREAARSELLPYLEDLQEALDYYNQVHVK